MTSVQFPQHLLHEASATQVRQFLGAPGTTLAAGLQLMAALEKTRPAVANQVLCLLYDVWWYETEKVFPGSDGQKWFASVPADSDFAVDIPEGDTVDEVCAGAVRCLRLREKFYGSPRTWDDRCEFAGDPESLAAFRHERCKSEAGQAVRDRLGL